MEAKKQIADEIRQLCAQYQQEVPSGRRAWPKSIKERVLALLDAELSCDEISASSGIPVATIYGWKAARGSREKFLPVTVVAKKAAPAAKKRGRGRPRSTPTIIVVMPNGIRFEGLTVASALELARGLS